MSLWTGLAAQLLRRGRQPHEIGRDPAQELAVAAEGRRLLADRAAELREGREAEERQAELDAARERELERQQEIEKERDSIAERDRGHSL